VTLPVVVDPLDLNNVRLDLKSIPKTRDALDARQRADVEAAVNAQAFGSTAGVSPARGLIDAQAARVNQALAGLGISGLGAAQVVDLRDQAGSSATADPIDELQKLADLRDRGALTDAEFEQQKRRLLGT
jgi:hypothetical protein